jgi:hypothetical protein
LRVTITHGKPQEEASSEDEQAQAQKETAPESSQEKRLVLVLKDQGL